MSLSLFAVTAPGVEEIAAGELRALGVAKPEVRIGGVEFEGEAEDLLRANLELRSVTRVLLRLGSFRASGFDVLRKRAARLPWERHFAAGDALALRVTCRKSRLYHSGAVAQRVAEAIAERLGFAPARAATATDDDAGETADAPGARVQLVVVRIERDLCTLSVDASGEPLHRRGYRLATGKAPLRETLAAAVLLASGWDARSPLIDPFCGAGTLAIEAALLARRIAPGAARSFACEAWPGFDASAAAGARNVAAVHGAAAPLPAILASDRDAGAVAAARANAERAGTGGDVTVAQRSVSALEPPAGPGWVVTNPPHGVRLSGRGDLRNLYARFGATLRARCAGWQVALLASHASLSKATGLPLEPGLQLVSGGLRLTLFAGRVPDTG